MTVFVLDHVFFLWFFFFGGLGRGHITQKMLFLLRISPAKVSCGFGYIYWRNPYWKTFFCAVAVCVGSECEQGIFKHWDWWERSELREVSLNWGHFQWRAKNCCLSFSESHILYHQEPIFAWEYNQVSFVETCCS